MAYAGMDALAYLDEQDPDKRIIMQAIADKVKQLHRDDSKALARLIRNEVAEAMSK